MEVRMPSTRLEGRLFTRDGQLCMVVEVDTEQGTARVSCPDQDKPQVIEVPICEVVERLSATPNLRLDGLNSDSTANRIVQRDEGWFFTSREGLQGPYDSDTRAHQALGAYILHSQEVPDRYSQRAS